MVDERSYCAIHDLYFEISCPGCDFANKRHSKGNQLSQEVRMSAVLKRTESVLDHCGIAITSELVTPSIAREWLKQNKCNRRLRSPTVDNYARDMAAGNWMPTTASVCFLADGSLANAQHTLTAILKSGKPQQLLIARNCQPSTISVMDRGLNRSITDVAHFLGMDFESRRAGITKACQLGWKLTANSQMTFHEMWSAYEQHREAVDFSFMLCPKKGPAGVNTTLLGIVARAFYTQQPDRLAKFVKIVTDGVCESPEDQAAIRYRDWSIGASGTSGARGIKEVYRRGQAALKHFLAKAPITKLYGIEGDVFEIPE